jgi:hypothetical protein
MQKPRLFGMNGVFALLLALTAGEVRGQQAGYLILVDAENKQPFTASIGENLMQSSDHGHLLIPQLQDSVYQLIIRFPRKSTPEQIFPVRIHKKDQGFQLQGSDGSWSLYNWQSRETIRPVKEQDSSRLLELGVKRGDGFSRLMAAVVNDSSVMYNTYAGTGFAKDSISSKGTRVDSSELVIKSSQKHGAGTSNGFPTVKTQGRPAKYSSIAKIQKKSVSDISLTKGDSSGAKIQKGFAGDSATAKIQKKTVPESMTVKTQTKGSTDTMASKMPLARSVAVSHVKKIREVSLKVSRKIVFLDALPGGEKDTVTLFVYFEQPEFAMKKNVHEDPMITARRLLRNDTATKRPFVQDKIKPAASEKEIAKMDSSRVAPKPPLLCDQTADDPDMEALRSAILIRNTEQEKISVASGAFALKCFSVIQLRKLAELFVSDRAKYKFLIAAYGHVSDADHFRDLSDLLTDKGYLKKFKAVVEKKG